MPTPVFSPDQVAALVKGVNHLIDAVREQVSRLIRESDRSKRTSDKLQPLVEAIMLARDNLAAAGVPDDILTDLERITKEAVPETFDADDTGKRLVDVLKRTSRFVGRE